MVSELIDEPEPPIIQKVKRGTHSCVSQGKDTEDILSNVGETFLRRDNRRIFPEKGALLWFPPSSEGIDLLLGKKRKKKEARTTEGGSRPVTTCKVSKKGRPLGRK